MTVTILLMEGLVNSSCTEDDELNNTPQKPSSQFITFTLPDEQDTLDTRTNVYENRIHHIMYAANGDSLHLAATITKTPLPKQTKLDTRAALTSLSSLSNFGVCAAVYDASASYTTAQCGSYFF